MALFNEILEGRFNNLLRKVMGIKASAPSAQLSSEIMPVYSPFLTGREMGYLEGWTFFRYGFQVSTNAGNASAVCIRVPGLSPLAPGQSVASLQRAVVVESIVVSLAANDTVSLQKGVLSNLSLSVAAGFAEDYRGVARSYAVCSGSNTGYPTLTGLGNFNILALTPTEILRKEYVLITQPVNSDGLMVGTGGANTVSVIFTWRERLLAENETI